MPRFLGFEALGLQLLMTAKTRVGVPFRQKLLEFLAINWSPFRLAVGTERATQSRALIPIQAQPLQISDDAFLILGFGPLPVRILNAKDKLSAHVPGEKPIEKGGSGPTHMEVPCGAWCETDSDIGHKISLLPSKKEKPYLDRDFFAPGRGVNVML
jgi:hypothetical protein